MRKIISVRRNRKDTMMWFVVHDSDRSQYEVWRVGPGDEGSGMETARESTYPYNDETEHTRVNREARDLARDLSDAA